MDHKELKLYLEWDYLAWGEAINLWNNYIPQDLTNKTVLEIGGRDGGLSIFFAKKGASVTCSDLNGVSDKAIKLHKELGLDIKHIKLNALELNEVEKYDYIVFKSVLGGIGYRNNDIAQKKALKYIYNSLKPNGVLLFAENSTGSIIHKVARRIFVKWANAWNYTSNGELNQILIHTGFKTQVYSFGFLSLFTRSNKIKRFLYFIDKILTKLLPKNLQYINYGIAKKELE